MNDRLWTDAETGGEGRLRRLHAGKHQDRVHIRDRPGDLTDGRDQGVIGIRRNVVQDQATRPGLPEAACDAHKDRTDGGCRRVAQVGDPPGDLLRSRHQQSQRTFSQAAAAVKPKRTMGHQVVLEVVDRRDACRRTPCDQDSRHVAHDKVDRRQLRRRPR